LCSRCKRTRLAIEEVGREASIFELVGAPQHNGKVGWVVSQNELSRRFVVEVQDDKNPLSLKPANLRPAVVGQGLF
jgi:hypothetical protein